MGVDIRKILSLSGGIAATVATGGATAPLLVPKLLHLASEFVPQKDAEKIARKAELDEWERAMVADWVKYYAKLLDIPMSKETKRRTFRGRLYSDFVIAYADVPKEEWMDVVEDMVAEAVRWRIASGGGFEDL